MLETAHVLPYRGEHTNDVSNGIILRADFHILFDEGLLALDPDSRSVILAPEIMNIERIQISCLDLFRSK